MAREADRPGTYRIKPKGDGYQVSGVDSEGARVKFTKRTLGDAEDAARSIFGDVAPLGVKLPELHAPPIEQTLEAPLDDWGMPAGLKVNEATRSMFAPKVTPAAESSVPPVIPAGPTPEEQKKEQEQKERTEKRRENAKSIAGLIGYGYTMGLVMVTRKSMEDSRAVVKPDPKELKKLQENVKDGITDTFGDKEIGPWTMVILLSFAIPFSMFLQSRKLSAEELEERAKERRKERRGNLQPVP